MVTRSAWFFRVNISPMEIFYHLNGHATGSNWLEVPTVPYIVCLYIYIYIYQAYFSGNIPRKYGQKYGTFTHLHQFRILFLFPLTIPHDMGWSNAFLNPTKNEFSKKGLAYINTSLYSSKPIQVYSLCIQPWKKNRFPWDILSHQIHVEMKVTTRFLRANHQLLSSTKKVPKPTMFLG